MSTKENAVVRIFSGELENIWHDKKEEPCIECKVLLIDKQHDAWVKSFNDRTNWKLYVRDEEVIMWAYIEDLLPKTK